MTSKDLFKTMGHISPEYRQQAVEALFAEELQEMEEPNMNIRTYRRVGRTLLIAVIAALLLAVTAFAADIFGVRALLTGDKITELDGQEYYELTLSYPQAVPEELDPAIAGQIENNQAAVAEWDEYCKNRPAVSTGDLADKWEAEEPAGTVTISIVEVKDDTATETCGDTEGFWAPILEKYPTAFALGAYTDINNEILGSFPITEEEWNLYNEQVEAFAEEYMQIAELHCGEYSINSREDADKLEEIAAKYGLNLVEEKHITWPGATPSSGDAAARELVEKSLTETMTTAGCAGNIFSDLPVMFDKIVWYDEGSFYINCDIALPSGQRATLRACKSMYSTLGGNEIRGTVSDIDGLATQSYTAADGTELTVLSDNEDVYVYTFLNDAFFAVNVSNIAGENGGSALTQEDINYIADFFHYSLIEG